MARIYETREITKDNKPTGKWRMTVRSDDEGWEHGLCEHEHDSPEDARECRDACAKLKQHFPMTKSTITIQIGNSDDKLSQVRWHDFCHHMQSVLESEKIELHFSGFSYQGAPWQNACWVGVVDVDRLPSIKAALRTCAELFDQESIALTVGDTTFVRP